MWRFPVMPMHPAIKLILEKYEWATEFPRRRLGRTNLMVSCIGFGSDSRYCNWVWRFDKKIAGSGPLGDLSAHSVDATRFVTGLKFQEVTGNLQTLVKERPLDGNNPDGPKGKVTVDDVAQFLVNVGTG